VRGPAIVLIGCGIGQSDSTPLPIACDEPCQIMHSCWYISHGKLLALCDQNIVTAYSVQPLTRLHQVLQSHGWAYHAIAAQVGLANAVRRICLERGAGRVVEQLPQKSKWRRQEDFSNLTMMNNVQAPSDNLCKINKSCFVWMSGSHVYKGLILPQQYRDKMEFF
jgi:hypothetical protein